MNRVLFCILLLVAACSSKSEPSVTTPAGDSTLDTETTEVAEATEVAEVAEADTGEPAPAGTFKNLQVLPKDISEAKLKATMKHVSKALGVSCDHCHVDENMPSDDMPNKLAARNMMTMTMQLNQDFFAGKEVVSCITCHKGAEHPAP